MSYRRHILENVIGFIKRNGSYRKPVPAWRITRNLNLLEEPTNFEARDMIRAILERRMACVLSNSKGYWLAENMNQIKTCQASLQTRADAIHERAWLLGENAFHISPFRQKGLLNK